MKTTSLSRSSDPSPQSAAPFVRHIVSPSPKTCLWFAAATLVALLTGTATAQVPQLINYQGRVAVNNVNFEGTGQFRFALVNADATPAIYWLNSPDTTPVDGVPDAPVSLTVTKGLYSVLLGDATLTNMAVMPSTVFNHPDVRLRVWFDDRTANGSQLLSPDQRIAAVGYAMMAGNAATVADGAITSSKLAAGAVGASNIAAGAIGTTHLATGAVQNVNIAAGAVGNSQLDSSVGLWTAFGGNVYRGAGNVGIGNTSPSAKLEISESSASRTPLRISNTVIEPLTIFTRNSMAEVGVISGANDIRISYGIRASADDDRRGFFYGEVFGGHFAAQADIANISESGSEHSLAVGVYSEVSGNPNTGYAVYGINKTSGTLGALGCGNVYQGSGDYAGVYGFGYRGVYGFSDRSWGDDSQGVVGESIGMTGTGVRGLASETYGATNYGGSFTAAGSTGRGVYGYASNAGTSTNYGGYFQADGSTGRGVYGYASNAATTNYGGYFQASGTSGRGVYGYADSSGFSTNYGGYFQAAGSSGRGVFAYSTGSSGIGATGVATGSSGTGVRGEAAGLSGKGVVGYGTQYDFYASGSGTNYGPFTGGHEVKLSDDFPADARAGLIVSVTGKTEARLNDDGGISISSTLPSVRLCNVSNDKAAFGVFVAETSLPQDHWYKAGEGERFATVNALGEGRVLVCSQNGEVEVGDYITTSDVPGHGQKQNDDLLRSCTIGKATESVDWNTVTETVDFDGRTYKVYLIATVYTSG